MIPPHRCFTVTLDLSKSYLVISSCHCKLCCTCSLLAAQCNQAVIYILSPVMIALKNVLWCICSLMHAKLLLALMGAVCAGRGGGGKGDKTPSPCLQVKINCVLLMLLLIALRGMAKAMHNWKFCNFLLFVLIPLVFFVTFLTIFDSLVLEKNCRMGPLFQRLGVCSVSCHVFRSLSISCP